MCLAGTSMPVSALSAAPEVIGNDVMVIYKEE